MHKRAESGAVVVGLEVYLPRCLPPVIVSRVVGAAFLHHLRPNSFRPNGYLLEWFLCFVALVRMFVRSRRAWFPVLFGSAPKVFSLLIEQWCTGSNSTTSHR